MRLSGCLQERPRNGIRVLVRSHTRNVRLCDELGPQLLMLVPLPVGIDAHSLLGGAQVQVSLERSGGIACQLGDLARGLGAEFCAQR